MMEKEYHFIEEIRDQPAAIKKSLETADPVIKNLARRYTDKIERIVLVGCGDPHMLSLGAVYAFERWAHIPAEAVEAAEFSLYRHELVNEHTLVILITSSGKTVKVIDAARLSKQRGAPMFALTNLGPQPHNGGDIRCNPNSSGLVRFFPYQADHLRAGGFIRPGFASGRNKGQHTRKRYFGIKNRVI